MIFKKICDLSDRVVFPATLTGPSESALFLSELLNTTQYLICENVLDTAVKIMICKIISLILF